MELWKIMFLSKWVICRFQPLIFQGIFHAWCIWDWFPLIRPAFLSPYTDLLGNWKADWLSRRKNPLFVFGIWESDVRKIQKLTPPNSKVAPENRPGPQKGNDRIPTIHFQVLLLMVEILHHCISSLSPLFTTGFSTIPGGAEWDFWTINTMVVSGGLQITKAVPLWDVTSSSSESIQANAFLGFFSTEKFQPTKIGMAVTCASKTLEKQALALNEQFGQTNWCGKFSGFRDVPHFWGHTCFLSIFVFAAKAKQQQTFLALRQTSKHLWPLKEL